MLIFKFIINVGMLIEVLFFCLVYGICLYVIEMNDICLRFVLNVVYV